MAFKKALLAICAALAFAGPHSRWSLETERQLGFRSAWQTYFRTHDVFLLPVAATAAFPHDHGEPSFERRVLWW